MLARKFENYRIHMAGTTQNKQKFLLFIVVPQGRKKFQSDYIKMEKKLILKSK